MKEAGRRRRRSNRSLGLAQGGFWCLANERGSYPKDSGEPSNFPTWGITQSGFHFWKITCFWVEAEPLFFLVVPVTTNFLIAQVEPQ